MIEEILEDYKKITEKIILNIKNDIDIISLMDQREKLIKELFINENNKEKVKEIYLSKGLLNLDEKLKISIDEEQIKVKEDIRNLHIRKNANNAYEKNKTINNFFNAKI
ncbi:flagellar protein FliT [Clostridium sp.]|uniref:flagellar protein FliT n=1 Tax=Clostridium sp. TaxID=1506 RepID=UPI002635DA04|nr:flagellar protein FliT [Clostridium sp.]